MYSKALASEVEMKKLIRHVVHPVEWMEIEIPAAA